MRSTPRLAFAAGAVASFALLVSPAVAAEPAPPITDGMMSAVLTGTEVRFATFNVRTSRADFGTSRHWPLRAVSVAYEIKKELPGIVAIQELGPGRADGTRARIGNSIRQTESLVAALYKVGASQYKLTRTTAYIKPGTSHGTQGTRILYDQTKYRLISNCRETTGKRNYNSSCSIDLPILSSDPESRRRSAAYAEFEDRKTGENFFVISAHLDDRHSGRLSQERALDSLRAAQVRAIFNTVKSSVGDNPVLFGGDLNSWRTKVGSNAPFKVLESMGFHDATEAASLVDAQYPTVNHWQETLNPNGKARQVALDVVMAKGGNGFNTYENVMNVVDPNRASDHNMVVSDLLL